MRKNSPRKWLHAILDLLPVILIPVFMIYSHRHEINDGSIQVQEKIAVDFNQKFDLSISPVTYNCQLSIDDGIYTLSNFNGAISTFFEIPNNSLFDGHKYLVKYNFLETDGNTLATRVRYPFVSDWVYSTGVVAKLDYLDTSSNLYIGFQFEPYDATYITFNDVQCFDLTQMFGAGNEPTISEFNNMFPQPYYAYTQSKKMLIDGDLVTYNDTDIMSQLTYQLYNSVDKYFNMGNVFNMTSVYDWFNLNIFNGNAPISIYIVWNIVLYEFVMDLLFLLYGLFMWFIDMVQHIMDKPFKSIK